MSWKTSPTVTDARREFLLQHAAGVPIDELCRHHGVSRSAAYELVARARREGVESAVVHRDRAPHGSPRALPEEMVGRLLSMRDQLRYGPSKLADIYETTFGAKVSRSAVAKLLHQYGEARRYRRRHARHLTKKLTQPKAPNDVWAADHKGAMGTQRVEPLTIIDLHSRLWLCSRPFTDKSYSDTRIACEGLFAEYGCPLVFRVDAGSPWVGVGFHRLTRLSAWWLSLGIRTEIVSSCQQNGVVERLHGTMEREMSLDGVVDVRKHFDRHRDAYNHIRPHQSLSMRRPADVYETSPRRPEARAPDYDDCDVVKPIQTDGSIYWRGDKTFVSEALVGHDVGLRQLAPKRWSVRFFDVLIGVIDDTTGKLTSDGHDAA